MDFSPETYIIAVLIFLLAAGIHGSIGFGFPMIATPLLALFADIQTAIILTLIPTLAMNLVSIASEGNLLVAFRRNLALALIAMTGSAIGTQILIFTNSELFKALLALAILAYLSAEKINLKLAWVRAHPALSRVVFGISAGLLGGLTNVMAPVLIIYSLEANHSKSEIIQTSNICFLLGKSIQLLLFSINGKFSLDELSTSTIMLVVSSIALTAGVKIRRRIKMAVYTKLLKALLFILAATLMIQVVG